ncbi:MAG: ATP-dependent zinc metalloprotease FtsH [Lachnospiraceae bacterium]|nr:ATP-dependent zinc metalloprotease FtsH [Lachnospiraceae bacterium]
MDDNNTNRPGGNKNNDNRKQPILLFVIFTLIAIFITTMIYGTVSSGSSEEVPYSTFYKYADNDQLEKVTFSSGKIEFTLKDGVKPITDEETGESTAAEQSALKALTGQDVKVNYYTVYTEKDDELMHLLKNRSVEITSKQTSSTTAIVYNVLSFVLPLLILWGLFAFAMRKMGGSGGGVLGVGKSNAKVYVEKSTGVTFKDVAGQDEAKESLVEVVDFLKNPKRYTAIGAKLPKGALLVGPPGTGKTLLAKAVAGEAGVPFFSLAGSDFVEMFVGVGASRVRDLFKEAQKQAPCIIFIDEIDAIGKSRDSAYGGGGNDEREQTLNQLLAEMDGFDSSKAILILAATNRPEVLDKALLRPGRFDRRIIVDRPDLKGREDTLRVHSKDVPMDDTVDLHALALATAGLVGSDLANIINEAAINAVKKNRQYVNQADLFEAFELVAVGGKEKKDRVMSDHERKIVSYHEVGHALVTALQKNTEPVQKITIVPRTMGALGYTLQTPEEEKYLQTKDELLAKIVTYMGGRAAEELIFQSPTSGASNDIEQATNIARNMVTRFGMSDKFGMMGLASVKSQYLDGRAAMECADDTAAVIDEEVRNIIQNAYDEATRMLIENREILDHIAGYLYSRETITGTEFMEIFRRMRGMDEPEKETTEKNVDQASESDSTEDSPTAVDALGNPIITQNAEMPQVKESAPSDKTTEGPKAPTVDENDSDAFKAGFQEGSEAPESKAEDIAKSFGKVTGDNN